MVGELKPKIISSLKPKIIYIHFNRSSQGVDLSQHKVFEPSSIQLNQNIIKMLIDQQIWILAKIRRLDF